MSTGEWLVSESGQAWSLSLVGSLIGSVIGAGVAILVMVRTLRTERLENVRARRSDTAASLLTNFFELADGIQREPQAARPYPDIMAAITVNMERLHLDLSDRGSNVYHALHGLMGEVNNLVFAATRTGVPLTDRDRKVLTQLIGQMGTYFAEWARARSRSRREESEELLADLLMIFRDHGLDGLDALLSQPFPTIGEDLVNKRRVRPGRGRAYSTK